METAYYLKKFGEVVLPAGEKRKSPVGVRLMFHKQLKSFPQVVESGRISLNHR